MPFYDLRCISCKKEFNIRSSISEKSENRIACPDCGSFEMESVFKSAPAYIKGSKAPECPNAHVCGAGCHHAH